MNKLLQGPPLKVLGHAGIGKVRQHKQEPLAPNLWTKRTRLDIHMHYHFGQLELVLTKWDKMKYWNLEQDPLTKELGDQAITIADTIRLSWATYDIKDESEVQEYITRSDIKTLYPRAVQYTLTDQKKENGGTNIQLHYHHMALLGQVLATCDCILTALKTPDRLQIAHLLAFLYQCLNMQQQPPMVDYRSRIEQRFEEIKNAANQVMDQDQIDWVKTLTNDVQTYILCYSTNDYRYQPLRGCSSVFDIMKQSTARPAIHLPPP
ncbi:hypothetical protein BC941DRAFT_86762 [Chlamydoabsidia padenii]|nr:hypothetical protein BC941DRAFT_86762 [Chlamydoabsidia padenii]